MPTISSFHWSDSYVGLAYPPGSSYCGFLAMKVSKEVFNHPVCLPQALAEGVLAGQRQVEDLINSDIACRVETPQDGSLVLMRYGPLWHIGIFCVYPTEPWVLHALANAGQVVRHRLRDLGRFGYKIEGFYQWL